ncbi:MAG: CbiQ family ECF transporter T component [bacterium]|jgi:cobalt/nickel transport system permease protein
MELALIDSCAYKGKTFLHGASTAAKVLLLLLSLTAVLRAMTEAELIMLGCINIGVLLYCRLPLLRLLPILFFPAFFGGVFAFSGLGGISPYVVVGKAVVAATSMLILLVTTPLPRIFKLLRFFLPRFLLDCLFITYHSFFILLESLGNLWQIFRLRGGFSPYSILGNINRLVPVVGVLLLAALDSIERLNWVLAFRGYGRRLEQDKKWELPNRYDFFPLALAMIMILVVIY